MLNLKNNRLFGILARVVMCVFLSSLVFYLALLVVEEMRPGFVSDNLNMDNFLIFVIIAGIINGSLVLGRIQAVKDHHNNTSALFLIPFFAILGAIVVFFKVIDFSDLAWVITFLVYFLIIAFGFAIARSGPDNHLN